MKASSSRAVPHLASVICLKRENNFLNIENPFAFDVSVKLNDSHEPLNLICNSSSHGNKQNALIADEIAFMITQFTQSIAALNKLIRIYEIT